MCSLDRANQYKAKARTANMKKLKDVGLEILSDWDGRSGDTKDSSPVPVTVRNTKCGHTFTSTSKNLLTRGVTCSVCAKTFKTNILNANSEMRSARWRQTAPAWKVYRAEVTKLTRITYYNHRTAINPHNLPTGRAGTEGAYHLDHIVPVRWCFIHHVPPEIVADVTNLEMIPWRDNIIHRDNLKGELPILFHPYKDLDQT